MILFFSLLHCYINYIVSTFKIIHMYILLFIIIRDEFDSTYAGLAAYTSGPKSTGVREIEFSKLNPPSKVHCHRDPPGLLAKYSTTAASGSQLSKLGSKRRDTPRNLGLTSPPYQSPDPDMGRRTYRVANCNCIGSIGVRPALVRHTLFCPSPLSVTASPRLPLDLGL